MCGSLLHEERILLPFHAKQLIGRIQFHFTQLHAYSVELGLEYSC